MKGKFRFAVGTGILLLSFFVMEVGRRSVGADSGDKLPTLILYSEPDFAGDSLVVTDTLIDLASDEKAAVRWNDEVRSIRVLSGTWRLYQHGRCNTKLDDTRSENFDLSAKERERGWSCLVSATSVGAVEFATSAFGDWNDDLSSIELVSEDNLPDWAMQR